MNLSAIDRVTPAWLTQALTKNGALQRGEVITVEKTPIGDTPFSTPKITRLQLTYSDDAIGNLPKSLIFKISRQEKERIFYEEIAKEMQIPSTPKCFYIEVNKDSTRFYFLLEDLGDTHTQPKWPIAPPLAVCEETMDCIAEFHAFWWQHSWLDDDLLNKATLGDYWQNRIHVATKRITDFLDFMSDRLSVERRKIYEDVLSSSNILWQPKETKYARTLLHGDAHFWNFLYPQDNLSRTRIFDWSLWDIGKGTDDLAYMIGLHWYPERRARFEKPLLERYHEALLKNGVGDYLWENCWEDYRHSAIMNLFIPVWQWQRGVSQIVWWPHLERSFLTFDDLNCKELL